MVGRVTPDKVTLVRKDGKTYYVFPDAAEIYQDASMNWGGCVRLWPRANLLYVDL
jgi:hypothetical protein